jgi:hypothetical protein
MVPIDVRSSDISSRRSEAAAPAKPTAIAASAAGRIVPTHASRCAAGKSDVVLVIPWGGLLEPVRDLIV